MSSDKKSDKTKVIAALMDWHRHNGRHALAWRHTRDPYRILVSELMLQQTQVARVSVKYEKFLVRFPTLKALANADRADVLRAWQGLGYNSRAVRLHALAKAMASTGLPQRREELLKLPGIGPYTAGAMIIFAHRKPSLSVDVNVERVLGRVFWPPTTVPARKEVDALALDLITKVPAPHHWHAALMDIGSAVCTARKPKCGLCPLYAYCRTRGTRPETIGRTPKQSKFHGSVRWWRGQILKLLLAAPVPEQHLLHRIKEAPDVEEQDRYEAALTALKAEGIVKERRGKLQV
jgi:A/G-specific adenine glycosylase